MRRRRLWQINRSACSQHTHTLKPVHVCVIHMHVCASSHPSVHVCVCVCVFVCVCVSNTCTCSSCLGRSTGPGKQCLVLSLVFYVPSEPGAQAALCGQEVAGLAPDRPMQLFTTVGHIDVCVWLCVFVCVCVYVRGCMCICVPVCMYCTELAQITKTCRLLNGNDMDIFSAISNAIHCITTNIYNLTWILLDYFKSNIENI